MLKLLRWFKWQHVLYVAASLTHGAKCSPDVAALLSTMPILSQPAPPPGIPAGIAPMRKLDASAVHVPCKHFAQGACSKGDLCEYAHVQADQPRKPAAAVRVRKGPRETPPVREIGQHGL